MSTIFISYSRADSRIVDRIDSELERHGFDCWVDRSDIGAGAAWRAEIAQAIRDCDAFVLVFSPRAAGSANITKELALAENNGKPIFPVVLENHPIPVSMEYQLAGIQQIQMTEKDFRNGMRQLIEALPQPVQGLSKPVAEKDIRLPKPPERKNGKHRRLIGLTVGFIGITAIVVIAINNMPLFTGGDYPVEPYTLGGETDYPDFQDKPVDGFRTDDITGEADDDIGGLIGRDGAGHRLGVTAFAPLARGRRIPQVGHGHASRKGRSPSRLFLGSMLSGDGLGI